MDRRTMVSTRRRAIQTMIFATTVCFLAPLPEVEGRTLGGCRLTNVPSASTLSPPSSSNRMPTTNNNNISRMERTSSRQWRRRRRRPPPSPNPPNNDKEEEARSIPTRIQQLRAGGRSDIRSSSTNNNTNNSSRRLGNLEHNVSVIVALLASLFRTVVPPVIIGLRAFGAVYRALPTDVLLAQAGLVYCFAGGYYPTLFAALSAAQHCGWHTMVQAVDDLFTEATHAMEVVATAADMETPNTTTDHTDHTHLNVETDTEREPTQEDSPNDEPFPSRQAKKDLFVQQTKIVLATIDPMKINQAVGTLYTTWMGVSSVLEREFAKTIALSLTIVEYLRPLTRLVVEPPIYWLLPDVYHRWVPILVGWGCKGTAMSVAWRLQRILTAYTSAITGGLMFARATMRMLVTNKHKKQRQRGKRGKNRNCDPDYHDYDDHDRETSSSIEEVIGFVVAGIGLHTQIGNGFKFKVPHPLSLVTWPFDILEKWIQWQITKDSK